MLNYPRKISKTYMWQK